MDVTQSNIADVYRNTHQKFVHEQEKPVRFNVGQHVRIMLKKDLFEHAYTKGWTSEIFRINKIIDKKPSPMYKLIDLDDNLIQGKFYEYELQVIEPTNENIPMKILKTRGLGQQLEYFVKTADNKTKWFSYKDKPQEKKTVKNKKVNKK